MGTQAPDAPLARLAAENEQPGTDAGQADSPPPEAVRREDAAARADDPPGDRGVRSGRAADNPAEVPPTAVGGLRGHAAEVPPLADAVLRERAPEARALHGDGARHDHVAGDADALLRAEGASVEYGLLRALREVDFEIGAGEVVAVLGANGAGKTTLAGALAGTVPLSGGRVLLDGQDITRQPAHIRARRGIALCHEGRRLFNELSVRDNLELATRGSTQIQRAFDLFPELAAKEKELAGRLSGGQQQMVAIARAMVAEPRVVIFDELSLGLAPLVIDRIYASLEQVRGWGISVVLIEQNVHRALAQANRVYVMERGRVSFSGTPAELGAADVLHAAYFGGTSAFQHSRERTHA
jgi:ABC-type branched-subunit amino acid transport system ATPase component